MADELRDDARGQVRLPAIVRSPVWELSRRLVLAIALLAFTVALVYFDRDGYVDNNDPTGRVGLIDSIYYTTVTLSTTGYGDIAPVAPHARLINAFLITPLRIMFLVLLIGTTIEVLATQGRELLRVARRSTSRRVASPPCASRTTSSWSMCFLQRATRSSSRPCVARTSMVVPISSTRKAMRKGVITNALISRARSDTGAMSP